MTKHIDTSVIMKCAYWWLGISLIIFLFTWFRPEIGIPFGILSVWAIWKASSSSVITTPHKISIGRKTLIWTLIITFLWVLFSGIGGFFFQLPWDHAFRNALFHELVTNQAPVIKYSGDGTQLLLCYYHAFWMLPALIAKLAGSILIGNIAQLLYAWTGLVIVSLLVFQITGKAKIWVMLLMLTFCGWEIANDFLVNGWNGMTYFLFEDKDIASKYMSAPSLRILTCYNYNQGIAAWMAGIILYLNRNNSSYLLLPFSLMLYFAPFPALGVMPFVAFYILRNLRAAISVNNIAGFCFCILIAIYFSANKHGGNPHFIFDDLVSVKQYAWLLTVFLICSYGIFMPFIWHRVKRDHLFWSMMLWSVLVPMIVLTDNDINLGIRMSIPFMCYFTIVMIKAAASTDWKTERGKLFATILAIGIASNASTALSVLKGEFGCIIKDRPFAAIWLEHDLFDKEKNVCYDNFISESQSIYTRYFIKSTNNRHEH